MTDLFPIPEAPSPRLAWLKKHDVHIYRTPHMEIEEEPWSAWTGKLEDVIEDDQIHTGKTEDEAITNLAKALNIPLWNEEGFKR